MLLAVEIDNTEIGFGLFEGDCLLHSFGIAADLKKTSHEYAATVDGLFRFYGISRDYLDGAILASVVPQLTDVLIKVVRELTHTDPMVVGKGIKTGFPIKIDYPTELGADLVANAAAALNLLKTENKKKTPCVIIDMGTATTIFALNGAGEYIGGSILPGVGISLEALHGKTALLPTVSPAYPIRAIGKNSHESVRSGVLLGHGMMVDGFIDRFTQEMGCKECPELIVTGEYAETVIPFCSHSLCHVPKLTLLGLACIYRNNLSA